MFQFNEMFSQMKTKRTKRNIVWVNHKKTCENMDEYHVTNYVLTPQTNEFRIRYTIHTHTHNLNMRMFFEVFDSNNNNLFPLCDGKICCERFSNRSIDTVTNNEHFHGKGLLQNRHFEIVDVISVTPPNKSYRREKKRQKKENKLKSAGKKPTSNKSISKLIA